MSFSSEITFFFKHLQWSEMKIKYILSLNKEEYLNRWI